MVERTDRRFPEHAYSAGCVWRTRRAKWSRGSVYGCSNLSTVSKLKELPKRKPFETFTRCSRLVSRMLVEARRALSHTCPRTIVRGSSSFPFETINSTRPTQGRCSYSAVHACRRVRHTCRKKVRLRSQHRRPRDSRLSSASAEQDCKHAILRREKTI